MHKIEALILATPRSSLAAEVWCTSPYNSVHSGAMQLKTSCCAFYQGQKLVQSLWIVKLQSLPTVLIVLGLRHGTLCKCASRTIIAGPGCREALAMHQTTVASVQGIIFSIFSAPTRHTEDNNKMHRLTVPVGREGSHPDTRANLCLALIVSVSAPLVRTGSTETLADRATLAPGLALACGATMLKMLKMIC